LISEIDGEYNDNIMNQTLQLSVKTQQTLERIRRVEGRSYPKILEEAVGDYVEKKRRWRMIRRWGSVSARKSGVSQPRQLEQIVHGTRR